MAKRTRKQELTDAAVKLLEDHQEGLKYSELVRLLRNDYPVVKDGNIRGAVWDLDARLPKLVTKPSRGLFVHTKFVEPATDDIPTVQSDELEDSDKALPSVSKISEQDFYQPFADWLIHETEECSRAIALGRSVFKDKWGTPDVIGKREPKKSDIYQPPLEIVSAEIKFDSNQLITAFGQSCAYKLFSHKVYLVIPDTSAKEGRDRLDSLCLLFGIGLVLYSPSDPDEPNFTIQVRPSKHEPDMFYVNKYLKLIESELFA